MAFSYAHRNLHSVNTNNTLTKQTAEKIGDMIIKCTQTKTKTKVIDEDKQSIYQLIYDILDNIREDEEIKEDLFNDPFRKGDDNYLHELFIVYFQNILLDTTELQNGYNSYEKDVRDGYIMPTKVRYYQVVIQANNFVNNIITKYISIEDIAADLKCDIFNEFKKYIKAYIFPEIDKESLERLSSTDKEALFHTESICYMHNMAKTTVEHNDKMINQLDKLDKIKDTLHVIDDTIHKITKKNTTSLSELDSIEFTKFFY